jgi:hypothetical protein
VSHLFVCDWILFSSGNFLRHSMVARDSPGVMQESIACMKVSHPTFYFGTAATLAASTRLSRHLILRLRYRVRSEYHGSSSYSHLRYVVMISGLSCHHCALQLEKQLRGTHTSMGPQKLACIPFNLYLAYAAPLFNRYIHRSTIMVQFDSIQRPRSPGSASIRGWPHTRPLPYH